MLIVKEYGLGGYYFVAGLDLFNSVDVNAASWSQVINDYDTT